MLDQILMKKYGAIETPSGRIMPKIPDKVAFSLNPANGANAPQTPGERVGLSPDQVVYFNNVYAEKSKGFSPTLEANTSDNEININLSGTAWFMLGFAVHAIDNFDDDSLAPISITLMINNEQVIQEIPWTLADVKYMTKRFFPYERFLNGKDDITMTISTIGVAAQKVGIIFYYK